MGYPSFAVLLPRLLGCRQLDLQSLARLARVPEPDLLAVAGGVPPRPLLLRRIAPVLNLHTADLFLIAGVPLPEDLLPLDAKARSWIPELVTHMMRLPGPGRLRLRQLAQSLPTETGKGPPPSFPAHEQYQASAGALLVRMLGNRNLGWTAAAQVLNQMTGLYLAASTIGAVGRGRKELTTELVAGFGTVLGIPADDLAVLTGIELPGGKQTATTVDVAQMIWDVRRLTAAQVQQLNAAAESMRQ